MTEPNDLQKNLTKFWAPTQKYLQTVIFKVAWITHNRATCYNNNNNKQRLSPKMLGSAMDSWQGQPYIFFSSILLYLKSYSLLLP